MHKVSLPLKVGLLMTMAILVVSASGYLTYNSLSSIVASIQVKSRPDHRLLAIREIAEDLDKAENSVRMYTLTHRQNDIEPYYKVLDGIDDKISTLHAGSSSDTALYAQIDTISDLIEENMLIWNKMLNLYHTDSLDIFIRRLSAKVAVASLNKKNAEKRILKRLFGRKSEKAEEAQVQQTIMNDLNRIEQQDSLKNSQLLVTESNLAATSNEIRERLYIIISRMEAEVINSIDKNAKAADALAVKTYRRLAFFAILGTLLVILVLVVVVRYVKKTREVQKALERSKEETEQLARTKELFMANMSHEIRTPVNAIYGFTEQLLHEQLDDRSRKMVGIVKSSADHLSEIVNDILDFSKLENAKIELEKVHFQIQALCEEIRLLFEKKVAEKKSHLYFTISKSTPLVLYGDAHRLKQILLNLIGNAVKFTEQGEIHVLVESGNITGNTLYLTLTIKDTGIGISKAMQSKVFDDFTQAEAGTSRKYGGTGLGLSIVKKLVELHEGEITLESQENKGTSITCRLPYEIGKYELLPAASGANYVPEIVKKLSFLIVDDEEYNRLLFKTILNRWQANFSEAENGLQAIELIKSEHYDIVFMDARMPVMDGLQATAIIRGELGKTGDIMSIIGFSATQTNDDLKNYRSAGMNAFLSKPFTEKMLLDTIMEVTGKEAVAAAAAAGEEAEAGDEKKQNLNLSQLYHLANHDVTFVKQLLITFIESTEHGIQDMQEALDKADEKTIGEVAHKISSPCKHIGADRLYASLKSIEEQARKPENLTKLAELSRTSSLEFKAIKKELTDHLGKMQA